MYQPYPVADAPQQPQRAQRPPSVRNAVRLMYTGAALEVVAVILAVLTRGRLRSAILRRHPHYTATHLHAAEVARISPLVVGGLIAIGLWIWMAQANGRGLPWARTLSAVFFGIGTLTLILSVLIAHAVATLIVGVIIWLVGLAVIVLLYSRESTPFFSRQPPR
jgi:hypothetical protein